MSNRVGVTFRFPKKFEPYEKALRLAGLEIVPMTPDDPAELDGLSGLVITGGTDVDPALYGAQPVPQAQPPDKERDQLEIQRLKQALERDLPLLAICRGMQLFNVLQGGTLVQHLEQADAHAGKAHPVIVQPETRLAGILGAGTLEVNSRHHQAIDRLGRNLKVSACSPDGLIEAFEHLSKRFAVGVQWHPEDLVDDPRHRKLFERFAEEVTGSGAGSAR